MERPTTANPGRSEGVFLIDAISQRSALCQRNTASGSRSRSAGKEIDADTSDLQEMRAAHRGLLDAYDAWMDEFRTASRTLRYEDLVPRATQIDEAFRRLIKASDSVHSAARNVAGRAAQDAMAARRRAQRRVDLSIADATFAAVSRSIEGLSRTAITANDTLAAAAQTYQRLARSYA